MAPAPLTAPRPFRFWELRRLYYNLVLFTVCLLWVVISWPHFRPAFTLSTLPPLFVLALAANVCYSTAYLLELPFLGPPLQKAWPHWRMTVWILGTLLAVVLANYWIVDEIYPFVR
jgi:hypothetical protein